MKHIIAINASPRPAWNTSELVRAAAKGAEEAGAEAEVIDLYRLNPFTGCISCFACKRPEGKGICVCKDGLSPVLAKIRQADGLILGTPNYLNDATAGFRALYERLIFQYLTYNKERPCCNSRKIPVLLIMTSNASEDSYQPGGLYAQMLFQYQNTLSAFVGPVRTLVYGDTLQVRDYSLYDWTMFDPESKKKNHDAFFAKKKEEALQMGKDMIQKKTVVR